MLTVREPSFILEIGNQKHVDFKLIITGEKTPNACTECD